MFKARNEMKKELENLEFKKESFIKNGHSKEEADIWFCYDEAEIKNKYKNKVLDGMKSGVLEAVANTLTSMAGTLLAFMVIAKLAEKK